MRVLMLTQFYPPIIGGIERHVTSLSRSLVSRGHDVSVATIWHEGMAESETENGVRVHRIKGSLQRLMPHAKRAFSPSFPDPEFTLALKRIIDEEKPDIVHAHNWLVYSFLPIKAYSKAKLVLTIHDHGLFCPNQKLIYKDAHCSGPSLSKCFSCTREHYGSKGPMVALTNQLMQGPLRNAVDMFVPVSRQTGEDNRIMGGDLPVTVIPNFVPDDVGKVRSEPHPKTAELPKGDFMLYVGAFGHYKGVDALLDAYKKMNTDVPLVIIGYKTAESPLKTQEFPPNVVVLYDWPYEAVMQAWQRCLFGIVPSIWSDPCPTTAIEGMAVGKAIVASRMGGLSDIVGDGATGLLVEENQPDKLATAMQKLIADPALRNKMGEAGRRKVREFQSGHVVNRIEALYSQLLYHAAPVIAVKDAQQ